MDRVAILMPVRNEAQYLPAALASLSRQTCTAWQLIAVNDGSTDHTARLLDEAAQRDPRIRVIHLPESGLVTALNCGLDVCASELVARMDADDICHPQRLAAQLQYFDRHPQTTLLGCRVRHFPRSRIQGGFRSYETWQNSLLEHRDIVQNMYVESPFAHPSVMFRRSAVVNAGGYRDMGWAEDYDLWLRLLRRGARFAKLAEALLCWRDHPQRLSRTGSHCSLDAFRRCKAHFLSENHLKHSRSVTLWGAGQEGKAWRKVLAGQGINVVRWIEVDPGKVGQVIHGAPVIGIADLTPGLGKILITIGTRNARRQVRDYAAQRGLTEGLDFICVT